MRINSAQYEFSSEISLNDESGLVHIGAKSIPKNFLFITGAVESRCGSRAEFVGPLERDFYEVVDAFDLDVVEVIHQPVRIRYFDETGESRRYTPDALVRYSQRSGQVPRLFEIKHTNELIKLRDELAPKFSAAKLFCDEQGWEFCVVTECEIRTPMLENARFLRRYRRRNYDEIAARRIITFVRANNGRTVAQIQREFCSDKESRGAFWPTLWSLVAQQVLTTDLAMKLTNNSLLEVPGD